MRFFQSSWRVSWISRSTDLLSGSKLGVNIDIYYYLIITFLFRLAFASLTIRSSFILKSKFVKKSFYETSHSKNFCLTQILFVSVILFHQPKFMSDTGSPLSRFGLKSAKIKQFKILFLARHSGTSPFSSALSGF